MRRAVGSPAVRERIPRLPPDEERVLYHADAVRGTDTSDVAGISRPARSLATAMAVAALFDAAAAVFLLARSGVAGSLADVVRVLGSRRALAVGACSLLGGPLFMSG